MPDDQALLSLIADLERELARENLPRSLRTRLAAGLERMKELLDAVRSGNAQLVDELIEGTTRGTAPSDQMVLRRSCPTGLAVPPSSMPCRASSLRMRVSSQ